MGACSGVGYVQQKRPNGSKYRLQNTFFTSFYLAQWEFLRLFRISGDVEEKREVGENARGLERNSGFLRICPEK